MFLFSLLYVFVRMSESQVDSSAEPKKRKAIETRSIVWDHFDKVLDNDANLIRGKCKYCGKSYAAQSKRHGTSSLNGHMKSCLSNPHAKETRQTYLAFQSSKSNSEFLLTNWVFNQENVRKALAKMVIIDELPFKFVEGRGFKGFVEESCPMFKIPSRWTVNRDIFSMFSEERSNLKKFFKENSQRICLTTDTWTSVQRINYMCITAHFIDSQWKLQKKIISFVPIESHKGESIAKAIELCLVDWGVKNIVTITVDNASSNDVAIVFLRSKLVSWGGSSSRVQYLHMRCIAHILNLVVQDGLNMADLAVKKVRDTIRWVRGSPARLSMFKELQSLLGVEEKSSLCLDVPTRWNSTYLMLKTSIPYRSVFEAYEGHDVSFKRELDGSIPDADDWNYLESFVTILKAFYEMTLRISGSLYVTSNSYLTEISDLSCIIADMIASPNRTEQVRFRTLFYFYFVNLFSLFHT